MNRLNTIKEAIEDFREGKFLIVVDDEDRENEGDLLLAADFVTPEAINFMITHARGLVCLGLTVGFNIDGEHSHMWDTCVPTFIFFNIPLIIFGIIFSMML